MAMSEKAKEAKRLYNREWQRKNKDKVKLYNERSWEKKAQMLEEQERLDQDKED